MKNLLMFIKFYQMLKPSVNNLNYLLILCFMCLCFVLSELWRLMNFSKQHIK